MTHRITILFMLWGTVVLGAPTNLSLRWAQDISAPVGGSTYYEDHQALSASPDMFGTLGQLASEPWAERIGIDALMVYTNWILFSADVDFDTGIRTYRDEDVIGYRPSDGVTFYIFDGSAKGLPPRTDIDAASLYLPGITNLLFSVDATVNLPGAGVVRDEDIILYNGSTFSKWLDGVANLSIPPSADIDALYRLNDDTIYFSLDKTVVINGYTGTAQDLWFYPPGGPTMFGGSVTGLAAGANLVALDEPVDSDGDWLTDFEEMSGTDEGSTVWPGSTYAADPAGHTSNPLGQDTDGDGYGDGDEAVMGTNPTNSMDYLRMISVQQVGTNDVITWASAAGRSYHVYTAHPLDDFWGFTHLDVAATGTYTSVEYGPSEANRNYRVKLYIP